MRFSTQNAIVIDENEGSAMSKKFIMTFEVDQSQLFDMIHKMKGDFGPVSERVIGAMLTGKTGMADDIGLALYGVVFLSSSEVETETTHEG
jgi:hypothetical protein